jgi:hypothetical protein
MHNKRYGLALSLNGWVEGHVGKGFVTQRVDRDVGNPHQVVRTHGSTIGMAGIEI